MLALHQTMVEWFEKEALDWDLDLNLVLRRNEDDNRSETQWGLQQVHKSRGFSCL